MKSNLYVITDVKAGHTSDPFACPNDSVAKRNFLFGCFASDTPPQDCLLWNVGTFVVDDLDCNIFGISETSQKLVGISVEEIEAYSKVYSTMHPEEVEIER